VFSEIFSKFTLGKFRDLNFELLFLPWFKGKNGKSGGGEKELGGDGKRKIQHGKTFLPFLL
jgi:hypothetical protein